MIPTKNEKVSAIKRIIKALEKNSAKTTRHAAILGALILIISNTDPNSLPPTLSILAADLGLNLLSNLIDRIADDQKMSNQEIIYEIQSLFSQLGLDEVLKKDELNKELATLSSNLTLSDVTRAYEEGHDEIMNLLRNQYEMLEELLLIVQTNRSIATTHSNASLQEGIIEITLDEAIVMYQNAKINLHNKNTRRAYSNALLYFKSVLEKYIPNVGDIPVNELTQDAIYWFWEASKDLAPASERLYTTSISSFFEYLVIENLATSDFIRFRSLLRERTRHQEEWLPQVPLNNIEIVIDYVINLNSAPFKTENEKIRNLRDRAFLITLADTGLRVHEACGLKICDIDLKNSKAYLVRKGDQQAEVRFSKRSLVALRDYLNARAKLDGDSGRPLPSLPLFARHDKGAGKKIKPITTTTGRNIVEQRVRESLGTDAVGTITPHSFRHYFVTTVLRGSGGNLKLAQELARHRNIAVTQRYAHLSDDELDRGYWDIFENTLLEPVNSQEKPGET